MKGMKGIKIKIFVFGTKNDPVAWKVAEKLEKTVPKDPEIRFIKTDNPDDITASTGNGNNENIIIMDAARGIKKPTMLSIDDLKDNSIRAVTAHDIDLGLTLRLLKKTGKLRSTNIKIIGIPKNSKVDEELVGNVRGILTDLTDALKNQANK